MNERFTTTSYLLATAIVLPACLGGCGETPVSTVRLRPVVASTRYRVSFDSIVNVGYTARRPLVGWAATAVVIEKTLARWYPRLKARPGSNDPSPRELTDALNALPAPQDADVSIVYLASSQTAAGEWEFTGKKSPVSWGGLLDSASIPAHPGRLVILDACHAAGVLRFDAWRNRLAPSSLLASSAGERTYELNFHRRLPLDLPRRFPQANDWLEANMPADWDGRVSFFGLIWLQAFLRTPRAPETRDDWLDFIRLCESESQDFRTRHSRRLASTVRGYISANIMRGQLHQRQ